MTLRKIDEKYLQGLEQRQIQLDRKIKDRAKQQNRINELFLDHVKKQLQLLISQKDKMQNRNNQYLGQVRNYSKQFNRILPELLQAEDKLTKAKINFQKGLQEHYK